MSTQFKICSCNNTMPLDDSFAAGLKQALGSTALTLSDTLCRREVGTYLAAIKGTDDVVVACTQERALFSELAQQSVAPLRPEGSHIGTPRRSVGTTEHAAVRRRG